MSRNCTDEEWRALLSIVINGPSIAYKVHKTAALKRSTAYKSLKEMEKRSWLKSEIIGKTYAGIDKKEYSLTISGLIQFLGRSHREYLEDTISHCSHFMPLVLGKWDYFIEYDVEDQAYNRLDYACWIYLGHWMPFSITPWKTPGSKEITKRGRIENIVDTIALYFYDPWYLYDRFKPFSDSEIPDKQRKWIEACIKDHEIKKFMIEELEYQVNAKKKFIEKEETLISILNEETEPDMILSL